MNKKVFALILAVIFTLAQFNLSASAPITTATVTVVPLDTFTSGLDSVNLKYGLLLPGASHQIVLLWHRHKYDPDSWQAGTCVEINDVSGLTVVGDTYTFGPLAVYSYGDQTIADFLITVADDGDCKTAANLPAANTDSLASTFIDFHYIDGIKGNPPSKLLGSADLELVSCNTFEYWVLGADNLYLAADAGYSGIKDWHFFSDGKFAPPAPEGITSELVSWINTLPVTANKSWTFSIRPEDMVGNLNPETLYFRKGVEIDPSEVKDCIGFSDTAGHVDEVYIRYLADLGLISGFPDATFRPDNVLTRAEAAVLFEKANGYTVESLPTTAPSGCVFNDVNATDWFAVWIWQACKNGFMKGIGNGLFDPNNLLTRGQVATIMNNVAYFQPVPTSPWDSFLDTPNVLTAKWTSVFPNVRKAVWTDVPASAYYADPVIRAYGLGVAEGTSGTTFSPDQTITRGEFAKWLYRALSRLG